MDKNGCCMTEHFVWRNHTCTSTVTTRLLLPFYWCTCVYHFPYCLTNWWPESTAGVPSYVTIVVGSVTGVTVYLLIIILIGIVIHFGVKGQLWVGSESNGWGVGNLQIELWPKVFGYWGVGGVTRSKGGQRWSYIIHIAKSYLYIVVHLS